MRHISGHDRSQTLLLPEAIDDDVGADNPVRFIDAFVDGPYSSSVLRGLKKVNYVNKVACQTCAIRSKCTKGAFRSVSRSENEAVLDRMDARIAQRPDILDKRRETVEHPFGTIKQWMNQGAFLMPGLDKVRGEFSLTALAYNLKRVFNIVEFPALMKAIQA